MNDGADFRTATQSEFSADEIDAAAPLRNLQSETRNANRLDEEGRTATNGHQAPRGAPPARTNPGRFPPGSDRSMLRILLRKLSQLRSFSAW